MTELEAITTAQLQTKQAVKGLEPLLEALIAAYVKGTKEVKSAISEIQAVKENKDVSKLLKSIDKSIGSYPKVEVIQEQKQTIKALQDVVKAVEKKELAVDLITIDLSRVEKCLEAIEQLIKIPLDDGRVAVKLSEKDLERLTKNLSVWQGASTNRVANIAGQEVNPATEDTLSLLLAQLQAINTNTDTLEIKAENVNLNTDQLESKLDTLHTDVIKIPGLSIPIHDYVSASYPNATTETYTYKTGGSGGTTVATVTVVYTDSTKSSLSSVTKT